MAHHPNHPQHHGEHHEPQRKGLHKDWRVWTAVLIMLGAMVIYVLSLDESIGPDGQPQPAIDTAEGQ